MRKVILKETQLKRLFETRMDGFRLDELSGMFHDDRIEYCMKMLGEPIGKGTSRLVFQLDDYSVLKLAMNNAGIAQNKHEIEMSKDLNSVKYVTKVLNGTDWENGLWVVSEYALPVQDSDFRKCFNVPFNEIISYLTSIYYFAGQMHDIPEDDKTNDLIAFFEYLHNKGISIVDLETMSNWGLVERESGPECVIIDSGLTYDIKEKFYED